MNKLSFLIGRIGLASLFILGGINKILNYTDTGSAMTDVGLQPVSVLLPLTILLEIGGALLIIMGRWKVHYAAFALALFTLATNWFFHDFWNMEGNIAQLELSLFFKNVAISGALVFFGGYYMQSNQEL